MIEDRYSPAPFLPQLHPPTTQLGPCLLCSFRIWFRAASTDRGRAGKHGAAEYTPSRGSAPWHGGLFFSAHSVCPLTLETDPRLSWCKGLGLQSCWYPCSVASGSSLLIVSLPLTGALFLQLPKIQNMLLGSRCPRVSPRRGEQGKKLVSSRLYLWTSHFTCGTVRQWGKRTYKILSWSYWQSQGQKSQLKHLRKKADNKGRQQKPELKLYLAPGFRGFSNPASVCYLVEPRGSAQGHVSGDLSFSKQPLPVISDGKGK